MCWIMSCASNEEMSDGRTEVQPLHYIFDLGLEA